MSGIPPNFSILLVLKFLRSPCLWCLAWSHAMSVLHCIDLDVKLNIYLNPTKKCSLQQTLMSNMYLTDSLESEMKENLYCRHFLTLLEKVPNTSQCGLLCLPRCPCHCHVLRVPSPPCAHWCIYVHGKAAEGGGLENASLENGFWHRTYISVTSGKLF